MVYGTYLAPMTICVYRWQITPARNERRHAEPLEAFQNLAMAESGDMQTRG